MSDPNPLTPVGAALVILVVSIVLTHLLLSRIISPTSGLEPKSGPRFHEQIDKSPLP